MAVSLLLWCMKTIGSRGWFPSISWKFRWSRNGRKVDEIEHRGHQIEDFDSKIHIPRSKYSRKAEKKSTIEIKIFQNFVKFWPDPTGYMIFFFDPMHSFGPVSSVLGWYSRFGESVVTGELVVSKVFAT